MKYGTLNDPHFNVKLLSSSENPQTTVYAAMRQDYCEEDVWSQLYEEVPRVEFDHHGNQVTRIIHRPGSTCPSEHEAGRRVVKNLLKGGKGHYGPLEHPSATFNIIRYPHSTMCQLRTHRVGVSFDVQSGRYTGKRIYEIGQCYVEGVPSNSIDIEALVHKVFYIRPEREYFSRQGHKYTQTKVDILDSVEICLKACEKYFHDINAGKSEEHARMLIPYDIRQSWVMTVNVRSLMHILDLRAKPDAQLEIQDLCYRLGEEFWKWCPEIAEWYMDNRWMKSKLSP